MKDCVKILSKSSSGNPYTVIFYLEDDAISASCSCPAGEHHKLCKHVLQIIDGNDSILYDGDQKLIMDKICSHLQYTPIPSLLSGLCEKEALLKELQQVVKKAKKNLEKEILKK